jgi:hypothetical protein
MNANATSGQEASESVDEQRARWERFTMIVLDGDGGGYVNVRNDSHGDDAGAHIYSVAVENGEATGCSCPHAVHRGAHCKHQVAVENRPLVVSSATAAGASPAGVATDGGRDPDHRCEQCGREDVESYVCDECADANDDRRDDDIAGSERADFGGGPSGVDEL